MEEIKRFHITVHSLVQCFMFTLQDSFKFGGVHCGALARVDFKLNNVTRTKANLIIDLSRFRDFSLKFIENDDQTGKL